MEENILEVKDLYVDYETSEGVVYAVNGLNFSMKKGQILGLVGETGAGKTTTALSILKLLPKGVGRISKGEIWFKGENLLEKDEHYMRDLRGNEISIIFQDPMSSLNPIHTVGEQIGEVLQLHHPEMKKDEIEKAVDHMMEMVSIPPVRKTEYPHQFSGGMKQRIVIAIALACEPDLLLADEPTTALDVTIQAQVLEMMGNLQKELGTAMILITHDLGVGAESCDSVAVMYAGQIIESGTIEDIFTGSNHHPYTTGLFGAIPDMESKKSRLDPIPGLMADPTKEYTGCRFAERCKHCTEACLAREPAEKIVGSHMIRCHLFQ